MLPIVVRNDLATQLVDAVIDTGFSGFLTLPSDMISTLGLSWEGQFIKILTSFLNLCPNTAFTESLQTLFVTHQTSHLFSFCFLTLTTLPQISAKSIDRPTHIYFCYQNVAPIDRTNLRNYKASHCKGAS